MPFGNKVLYNNTAFLHPVCTELGLEVTSALDDQVTIEKKSATFQCQLSKPDQKVGNLVLHCR